MASYNADIGGFYLSDYGWKTLLMYGYTGPIPNSDYFWNGIITVTNIKALSGIHPTYCFNEPEEHAGIFNCILTGQSEVYSEMLNNIIKDTDEKLYLFDSIKSVPSIKNMADWAFKWIESLHRGYTLNQKKKQPSLLLTQTI